LFYAYKHEIIQNFDKSELCLELVQCFDNIKSVKVFQALIAEGCAPIPQQFNIKPIFQLECFHQSRLNSREP